jgi:lipopolysaccharide transport system ATP-binding protein
MRKSVTPLVTFEHVGKRFTLHHDRPRSFREFFVRPALPGQPAPAQAGKSRSEVLWALKDVSFSINRGETVGLVGANGAGKSTALKLISRVIVPNEGRVAVNGRVAALLELGTGFHPELSGRDNIFLSGALIGMGRTEMSRKFDSIVDFSEMESFIDVPVKHYSSGMFARLAFAVSIHLDPELLLVDEVLAVGDAAFQRKCLDRIAEMQRTGISICLVSHATDAVRDLCERAIWFDHGRVVADGATEGVVRRYLDRSMSMTSPAQNSPANLPSTQRWGSGKVMIEAVRLLNEHGAPETVFETGQEMVIELDYNAPEPVADAVFGTAVQRHDGLHISGPNTDFAGFDLPGLHGRGTIVYRVPYLTLLDGYYDVSVAAHNRKDTEMFDYHDRGYSFRVSNRSVEKRERYGIVTLRGEWQHLPAGARTELIADELHPSPKLEEPGFTARTPAV